MPMKDVEESQGSIDPPIEIVFISKKETVRSLKEKIWRITKDQGYISEKQLIHHENPLAQTRLLKIDPHENVRDLVNAILKTKRQSPFIAKAYRISESTVLEVRSNFLILEENVNCRKPS